MNGVPADAAPQVFPNAEEVSEHSVVEYSQCVQHLDQPLSAGCYILDVEIRAMSRRVTNDADVRLQHRRDSCGRSPPHSRLAVFNDDFPRSQTRVMRSTLH